MAEMEGIVSKVAEILSAEFPAMLEAIQAEANDGIRLEPPRDYSWEEISEALRTVPIVLVLGEQEEDLDQRDMLYNVIVRVYIIVSDKDKRHLTKKIYRYAAALKRIVRKPLRRTLDQTVVSMKVLRIQYSPTFTDRDNLFARDLNAELAIRVPR